MDKMFLTVREVSTRLGVSEKTIYRMLTDRQIPLAVKIGGQWRFKADEIGEWINSQKSPAPSPRHTDYRISPASALRSGAIFYRIHGPSRDEVIDELLSALPNSAALDLNGLKVSIFSRESVVCSSLAGIACLMIDPNRPVFFERTMLLLAYLEAPVDLQAIDGVLTFAIFLILPANLSEQMILDMKLRRLLMDTDFVASLRQQPGRKELLEWLDARQAQIFGEQK